MPCCSRKDFDLGFMPEYERLFGMPPNANAKRNATRDWNAGNTGWEAAQNAARRVKDRAIRQRHREATEADKKR